MRSAIVVAFALLVGTCAACGTAPPPPLSAAPPVSLGTSPGQRVAQLEQRTVALIKPDELGVQGAYCTGVWVRYDEFLTAAHCTRGKVVGDTVLYATRTDVVGDDVTGVRAGALAARDEEHDLALVRDLQAPAHASAKISVPTPGQNVHTMGHPLGLWWSYSRGEVSALRLISFSESEAMWWVQTTAPISPGNSGGGLFDDDADLVGVCALTVRNGQNVNIFVDPRYAKALLEGSGT